MILHKLVKAHTMVVTYRCNSIIHIDDCFPHHASPMRGYLGLEGTRTRYCARDFDVLMSTQFGSSFVGYQIMAIVYSEYMA